MEKEIELNLNCAYCNKPYDGIKYNPWMGKYTFKCLCNEVSFITPEHTAVSISKANLEDIAKSLKDTAVLELSDEKARELGTEYLKSIRR